MNHQTNQAPQTNQAEQTSSSSGLGPLEQRRGPRATEHPPPVHHGTDPEPSTPTPQRHARPPIKIDLARPPKCCYVSISDPVAFRCIVCGNVSANPKPNPCFAAHQIDYIDAAESRWPPKFQRPAQRQRNPDVDGPTNVGDNSGKLQCQQRRSSIKRPPNYMTNDTRSHKRRRCETSYDEFYAVHGRPPDGPMRPTGVV